jgi:O-antigen/teichoic acid export membrane protein
LKFKNHLNFSLQRFKSNIFYQNIALLAGGAATAQIVTFLSMPVITRLYSPEDYGLLSVFAALTGVIGSLSTLRYAVTIPLANKEEMADNLLKLSFVITIGLSFIIGILILFFGRIISEILSVAHINSYLWIIPVVFMGTGIFEALSNWSIRQKYFRIITQTKISQSVSGNALKIALGSFGIAPLGLLLGFIATFLAGIGRLSYRFIKEKPRFFSRFSINGIWNAARCFRRFPIIQSWASLILTLSAQLPFFLVAALYGTEVVGLFGLAHILISMPMSLLGVSAAQVYYGEISKLGISNPGKIYNMSVSLIKKMFLIAIIPVGMILLGGPWAFGFFFGDQWYDAGVYARLLSFIILTQLISSPIEMCFSVMEMQGTQLVLNIIRLLVVLSVFVISKILDLSAFTTIGIYSGSLAGFYLLLMLEVLSALKKKVNISRNQ